MKKDKPSKTADFTAAIRARHQIHDSNLIFEDPLASKLTSQMLSFAVKRKMFNWLMNSAFVPNIKGAESLVLYRAHYIEEKLHQAIREGCMQYVIIAAGMDSFAYRYSNTKYPIKVFELDHPATQAVKLKRLNKANIKPNVDTEYIAVNLEDENLSSALQRSSYNNNLKTFFSCAGLTYYLPKEKAFELFNCIANTSAPQSTLIFDYAVEDTNMTCAQRKNRNKIRTILKLSGEQIKSNFDVTELIRKMSSFGYQLKDNAGPSAIDALYFKDRPADGLRTSPHNRIGYFQLIN